MDSDKLKELIGDRKPLAIQGQFMWSCGDSFGSCDEHRDHLPPEWCFSRAFRGPNGFRTVYDTEEEAMAALEAGLKRLVEEEKCI
jgi:hypothetical protein